MILFAHGIAGRADLPIPVSGFAAAAAAVLVLSFLALAAGWREPRLARAPERAVAPLPRVVELLLGALGIAAFALVLAAAVAGPREQGNNLAPTAVYVGLWVGVPFASLLLGDVFRLLSPWRALGRAAGWLAQRAGTVPEAVAYPERLGRLPAAGGLLVFAVCELCWAWPREPEGLAVAMVLYLLVMVGGMSLFGVEAWTRNADPFGVLFSLFATLAPVGREPGGRRRLTLRVPGKGAAIADTAPAGVAAVLLTSIGATAYDGAKEGPAVTDAVGRLQRVLAGGGLGADSALTFALVAGLLVAVAVVAAVYAAGIRAMRGGAEEGTGTQRSLARAYAPSLVPLAAGYLVAHYCSLLLFNGQDLARLASDPFGTGADLLGAAGRSIDYSLISATGIWYVQVAALVGGHVAGLALAHDRALERSGDPAAATRSQIVMLCVMVGFTILGLALLSAALNS